MESKKISVITSTRNREHFLPSLYCQFLRQTYENKELIVFDDSAIPSPFFSSLKNPAVRYIHGAPKSTGQARNFLTEQASGDIIAIFDDDDFYMPKYLSGMVAKLGDNDLIKLDGWYVYSRAEKTMFYWDTTKNSSRHFRVGSTPTTIVDGASFDDHFIDLNKYGYGFSYVFTKAIATDVPFDTEWNADYCFVKLLDKKGAKIVTIPSSFDDQDFAIHTIHGVNCSCVFPQEQIPNVEVFDLGDKLSVQNSISLFSACIIVKNEEVVLPKLLNSLHDCDDVVVLDTGSTDKTMQIAKQYKNVNLQAFKWTNSFAEARNVAASYAKHEWIAWLDADLWFPEGEIAKINELMPKLPPTVDAISLKINDVATGYVFPSPRIYHNHLKFTGDVHEDLGAQFSCITPFIINHERTELPGAREKKDERYLKLLHNEYKRNPKSLHALLYLRDAAYNSKDWKATRKYCNEQLALEDDYIACYYLGRLEFNSQSYNAALHQAFRALQMSPFDPRVCVLLGDTYDEMGKKVEALTWYQFAQNLPSEAKLLGTKYAVAEDDYVVIPRVNQAKTYVNMGMKDKALKNYSDAIQLYPGTHYRTDIDANIKTLEGMMLKSEVAPAAQPIPAPSAKPVPTIPVVDKPLICVPEIKPAKKLVCAFTMTRDDPWLWLWCSYYINQLGGENCFILYEPGDKRSLIDKARFPEANWIEFPNPHFSKFPTEGGYCSKGEYIALTETWRCEEVYKWQGKLLEEYECVIFGDCDELLCPIGGAISYCKDRFLPSEREYVRSCCWQPIHQVDGEPAIKFEPGEHILANRGVMWRSTEYDKTLLVRKPQRYCKGYHYTTGLDGTGQQNEWYPELRFRVEDPIDPYLPLLHFWKLDFDLWFSERQWRWSLDKETALTYFRTGRANFRDDGSQHSQGDPQLIPQCLKDLIVLR